MANEKRIGALWLSKSANPKAPFAKGVVKVNGQEIRVVVWQRQKASGEEKKPDFIIELEQPRMPPNNDVPF